MTTFHEILASMKPRSSAEMNEWSWRNEIVPRLNDSGLPPRFQRDIVDWPQPGQKKVYELARKALVRIGSIVVLVGPRGVGKTSIAAQLIVDRARNEKLPPWERVPPYRKMADVVARYKPLYADFGSVETQALMDARDTSCRDQPLLVIDELHECDDQKMKSRVLTDIIDRRYAARNDTVLISNQTPQDFQKNTNDSILSRLSEHGMIIPCNWTSFRKPKNTP